MLFNNNKAKGFTLTEILLAVAIVGLLAALVLPSAITKFNENVLEAGFVREQQAVTNALDILPIKENKSHFGETSMYSDGTKSIEDTSGKFMKRYLRVSKYYGDVSSNKDAIKKECFASSYSEYSEGQKKDFVIDDLLTGACAKLKNGASLCLAPQVGANTSVYGVMDINGPKPPNIMGKDLRVLDGIKSVAFSTRTSQVTTNNVSTEVLTESNPDLVGDGGYTNLCKDDYSEECCHYLNSEGKITDSTHMCCSNTAVASQISVCASKITLRLNLYPSNCNNRYSSCRVYVQAQNTTAKLNNQGSQLTSLPATPPDVLLYCDGKRVGSMSGATLMQAVIRQRSEEYYFTKTSNANATCGYQSGQGLKSSKSSVVFDKKGSSVVTKDGVTWTLTYY